MHSTPGTPARILLVDDHPILRYGVRQLLANLSDLEVCGEADSLEDALHAVSTLAPDLVVVDLSLGAGAGLELIRRLRTRDPGLPVVVFSMHDEAAFAELAFAAGARQYVMKQESPARLIRAIREALTPTAPPGDQKL
jgi:DNA-binding NarL/FixJ family response regulator